MSLNRSIVVSCALSIGLAVAASGQGVDPPARVGRVSDMLGAVSLYPIGASDWSPGSLNYPLTTGDALWADNEARAEVHLGSSAVRIGPQTSLDFGEISDTVTQIRLDQGSIDVHVRALADDEVYEIDTPAGVISLLDEGHYRIDVTSDGRRTTVTVRDGGAQVSMGDRDFQVRAGASATLTGSNRAPIIGNAIATDDWERWADDRDRREDASASTRYVSRDMVGYEDLDEYGDWRADADYGAVWTPRNVPAGWAPYRYGHWESIEPWGWTWIDDARWGFAPFHYGRWTSIRGRWSWVPGTTRLRPVYAPALVAFVNGPDWGASRSFGGGPGIGWVPLAPGEAFIPAYRASPTYVARVNVTLGNSPRYGRNGENGREIRYVNRDVPGAVTAVPRDVFARSRPVATAAVPIRPSDIATARPTPAPIAGNERIAPVQRGQDRGRGQGRGEVTRPPTPPSGAVAPPTPTPWRARPRPGMPAPADPRRPDQPNQPPPPPQSSSDPRRRDGGQPVLPPTPQPPPPTPPPGGQGQRGRGGPPPVTPPVTPPPAATPPPAQPPVDPPAPPPGGQGQRGRAGLPPATPPPVQPPPVTQPPVQPPPPPPGDLGRGRPRPGQAGTPQTASQEPDNTRQWQEQRSQLIARQQTEASELVRQQQAELKQAPPGTNPLQLQKVHQAQRKALEERQQRDRDQLDKQFRKPGGKGG